MYILYLFIEKVIPLVHNQIETTSTEYAFQDSEKNPFNPFLVKEFHIAIGTKQAIDPKIATYHMEYEIEKDGKKETVTAIDMKRCDKTDTDDYDNLMCYDDFKKGDKIGAL